MPFSIAFAWSKEIEKELEDKGFEKRTVYIKQTGEKKAAAEHEFWEMKQPPFQFAVTDFWGAGPD